MKGSKQDEMYVIEENLADVDADAADGVRKSFWALLHKKTAKRLAGEADDEKKEPSSPSSQSSSSSSSPSSSSSSSPSL